MAIAFAILAVTCIAAFAATAAAQPPVFDGGKRKGSTSTTIRTSGAWYKEFSVVEGEITENNVRLMGATLNVAFDLKR